MSEHSFTDDEVADLAYSNPAGWRDADGDGKARIIGKSRWSFTWRRVITDGVSFYEILYSEGATEYQEASDEVTITKVYPHEVTVIKYKETPNEV
jgi:hypothetical protein